MHEFEEIFEMIPDHDHHDQLSLYKDRSQARDQKIKNHNWEGIFLPGVCELNER